MQLDHIYFEPNITKYPLGKQLLEKFSSLPQTEITSHNRIPEMQSKPNSEFVRMKRNLIIGIRKTHQYVKNEKISDYLVPYTSSGCTAMCLYCYLVCNYNKCSYLRLFVNREEMLEKLIRFSGQANADLTYEIGSNSDLILENTITENLLYTIPKFALLGRGRLTFPTKFGDVSSLLALDHKGKTLFRMSVNPPEVIRRAEIGTDRLEERIRAVNEMCEAGYPVGILIAPVIAQEGWKPLYAELISRLSEELTGKVKRQLTLEIIFMTYSFVHRAINADAFPGAAELYDPALMQGSGRGKYYYRSYIREDGEEFLRQELKKKLPEARIIYFC